MSVHDRSWDTRHSTEAVFWHQILSVITGDALIHRLRHVTSPRLSKSVKNWPLKVKKYVRSWCCHFLTRIYLFPYFFSNHYMVISRFFWTFWHRHRQKVTKLPWTTLITDLYRNLWFSVENRANGPWISPSLTMYRPVPYLVPYFSKHSTEVSSWRIPRPSDSILVSITCEIQENCKTMSRPVKNHCNQSKSGHWRTEK